MINEEMEVFKAVGRINCDLSDQAVREEDECYLYLTITSNWFYTKVTFLKYDIWNSEDDERVFCDEKDEYEPLEGFLRKEICRIFDALREIKI